MDWKNSHTLKERFTYENAQDTIDQNKGEFLEELVNLNRIAKHHRKNVLKTDLLILNQTK